MLPSNFTFARFSREAEENILQRGQRRRLVGFPVSPRFLHFTCVYRSLRRAAPYSRLYPSRPRSVSLPPQGPQDLVKKAKLCNTMYTELVARSIYEIHPKTDRWREVKNTNLISYLIRGNMDGSVAISEVAPIDIKGVHCIQQEKLSFY